MDILLQFEKTAESYLVFSFGETPTIKSSGIVVQQSGSKISSSNESSRQLGKSKNKFRMLRKKEIESLKNPTFTSQGMNYTGSAQSFYEPINIEIVSVEQQIRTESFKTKDANSPITNRQTMSTCINQPIRRTKSFNDKEEQKVKIMNHMKNRLSGMEYQLDHNDKVSYCSFGSFKDYQALLPDYDTFTPSTDFHKYDKYQRYRHHILKIKVMMALKMNYIKRKAMNKIVRSDIKPQHPFYIVALLKHQFGNFRKYVSIQNKNAQKQLQIWESSMLYQKKLWVVIKSLQVYHRKYMKNLEQLQNSNHNPSILNQIKKNEMLFNRSYRIKRGIFDRLIKYKNIQQQRKLQNFKAIQIFLKKYQTVSLYHWKNLFKYRKRRAKNFSKILKKLVNRKYLIAYQRFCVLTQNFQFYKKFVLERENFLYTLKDHELAVQTELFGEHYFGTSNQPTQSHTQTSTNIYQSSKTNSPTKTSRKNMRIDTSSSHSSQRQINEFLNSNISQDKDDYYQFSSMTPNVKSTIQSNNQMPSPIQSRIFFKSPLTLNTTQFSRTKSKISMISPTQSNKNNKLSACNSSLSIKSNINSHTAKKNQESNKKKAIDQKIITLNQKIQKEAAQQHLLFKQGSQIKSKPQKQSTNGSSSLQSLAKLYFGPNLHPSKYSPVRNKPQ